MDRRVKPGDDELFRCRDAPCIRALPRQEKPSQEALQGNSSLKRREAERREAHQPGAASTSDAARALSCLPTAGRPRPRTHRALGLRKWSGRARLSAPHRGIRGFCPRLGSGRASWNHRMQTGGPSPAPVQRAPRGPTRAGRDDAQAARERSVWLRPTRTAPAPPQGVPSRKASLCERDGGYVTVIGIKSRVMSLY